MSMIHYRQASYATQLREQLEMAGCESKVAAIVSRTVGELIDHLTQALDDLRREAKDKDFETSMRQHEIEAARSSVFERLIAVTLFVLAVALVAGILVALFR